MVLGQQRLGVNLLSLTRREEGRLPIRSVQWYLDTVHHPQRGGHRERDRAGAQPAVPGARIRASPVVHADEA